MTLADEKISIKINLPIFDTKIFFNTYPKCLCWKEGWMCRACCKAITRQSLWVFFRAVLICSGNLFLATENLITLFSARVV